MRERFVVRYKVLKSLKAHRDQISCGLIRTTLTPGP